MHIKIRHVTQQLIADQVDLHQKLLSAHQLHRLLVLKQIDTMPNSRSAQAKCIEYLRISFFRFTSMN